MSDSAFNADWLALRAPFDAAATERGAAAALARDFGTALRRHNERGTLRLLDLGGGTGANVCRLAPRIAGSQHWTVVDHDAALLGRVADTVAAWARRIGARFEESHDNVRVTTPQRIVTVSWLAADLRDGFAGLPLGMVHGVTGAALLDLVSADWLAAASNDLAAARLPALFTLSVDGAMQWRPAADDDSAIAASFVRDLARDKGFGPALGTSANAAAAARFAASGYTVATARSDWQVGSDDVAMHRALLAFMAPAVRRQPPMDTDASDWIRRVDAWAAAKTALADAGTLAFTLGHGDVLAVM